MGTYWVIGDIHGRFHALLEVFKLSKFDFENDKLVVLGDVVDGGYYTKACIDLLLNVKHMILIEGNHDKWALHWFLTGKELPIWYHQGGINTIRSYGGSHYNIPQSHIDFLNSARPYYIDDSKRIFVHGGFDPYVPIEGQDPYWLMWDRSLIDIARGIPDQNIGGINIPHYSRVFVGHTTTQLYGNSVEPLIYNNLVMMDTGGGWNGKLTIMDVETLNYHQSKLQRPSHLETYIHKVNARPKDLETLGLSI
jgi:serine/threonine protein phosphatase 1